MPKDIRSYGWKQIMDYIPEDRPDIEDMLDGEELENYRSDQYYTGLRGLRALPRERGLLGEIREAWIRSEDRRRISDLYGHMGQNSESAQMWRMRRNREKRNETGSAQDSED